MRSFIVAAVAAHLGLAVIAYPAAAQPAPSVNDFIRQLKPADPVAEPPAGEGRAYIGRTRGLSLGTGGPSGAASTPSQPAKPPSISFQVEFAFNSAQLTPDATQVLDNLGQALTSPELAGFRYKVNGHTDGVGSAAYNKTLSARRAASVRDYLVQRYNLPSQRFQVAGLGATQLLDPSNPAAAANRRVEVQNLGR